MIQQATQQDIPQLSKLLQYICDLHAKIRPDLFAAGKSKYNEQQLLELLQDSSRPIFVYRNYCYHISGQFRLVSICR